MAYFPGQGPFDPHVPRAQASSGTFNPHVPRTQPLPSAAAAKAAAVAHPVVVAPVQGQPRRREVLNHEEYGQRDASFSAHQSFKKG